MAEINIPYLPSAKFFKVLCRLGVHEQDISSDTDSNPQIRTIGGTVTISASIGRFRYTEADGRSRVIYNKTEAYNIQTSTGELFDVDGNLGVNLLDTTSPGIDPQGWTYKATVRPTGGEPFDVNIPASLEPGGTLDLGDGLVFTPSTGITDLETRVKALEDAGPSSGGSTAWADITDKPSAFTPSEHRHDASEIDNLPSGSGGGSSSVTADDTPAAPTEGGSASYLVTSAVTWPAGLVWSTDPDGGVAPTITGVALVSLFTVGGVTRAILGATFQAPVVPDTTPPTPGTLTPSLVNATGFLLIAGSAFDAGGLHAQPYRFSIDGGSTWSAWQTSEQYAVNGRTPGTAHTCRHEVRDAAGLTALGASVTVTTAPASTIPQWSATFTMGTPTILAVIATASALATDDVAVTGYEVSYNGGTTWAAITPSGSNFTLSGASGTTYANTKLRAKDAAGNYSAPPLSVPPYTLATSMAPTVTYRSTATTDVPIGDPSATRTVLVAYGAGRGGGAYKAPTGCTIGGVAATRDAFSDASQEGVADTDRRALAVFRAVVPTGTTASISFSGTDVASASGGVGVWTSDSTLLLVDSEASSQTHNPAVTLTTANGFAIAHGNGDFGSGTWVGATERYDASFNSGADAITDGSDKTITFNGWDCRIIAASYQEGA